MLQGTRGATEVRRVSIKRQNLKITVHLSNLKNSVNVYLRISPKKATMESSQELPLPVTFAYAQESAISSGCEWRELLRVMLTSSSPIRKTLTQVILRAHIANVYEPGVFLSRVRQLMYEAGLPEDVCDLRLPAYTSGQSLQALRRAYSRGAPQGVMYL